MSETYQILLNYVEDHFSEVDSELLRDFAKKVQRELASRERVNECTVVNNWQMLSPSNKATYKFTRIHKGLDQMIMCTLSIEENGEIDTFLGIAYNYGDRTKEEAKRKASACAMSKFSRKTCSSWRDYIQANYPNL